MHAYYTQNYASIIYLPLMIVLLQLQYASMFVAKAALVWYKYTDNYMKAN